MKSNRLFRVPYVVLGLLSLLGAMWGALVRLEWGLPELNEALRIYHGPLMVVGFLGTLVGLERAVALARPWTYAAPTLTALGAVALVAGPIDLPGVLCMFLGSLGLVAIMGHLARRQLALFTVTLALAAACLAVGNALWLARWPIYRVVPWWVGFLILTIAGERLELTRLLQPPPRVRALFAGLVALLLASFALSCLDSSFSAGIRVMGAALIALALWLLRYDIARKTVRQQGLPRFAALCLLTGYGWLAAGGALALVCGGQGAGMVLYDAQLHALFLGFVFAMILGHAPIILPAVMMVTMPFRRAFYLPLALLHASLAVRIAGDLAESAGLRQWGGMLNVVTLLVFLAVNALSVRAGIKAGPVPGLLLDSGPPVR